MPAEGMIGMGQIKDRLSKLVGQPKKAKITRAYLGETTHNGFVLGLGCDLVLLQQYHDFYPEGYTALRAADIKRTRSGEYERFWEAMFQCEGLMGLVGIPYEVPLDGFRALLTALDKRSQHVFIECESQETADDDFFIGRVVSFHEETVSILPFNSSGAWGDEPTVIA
jgi:hypothetical protein